MSNKIKIKRGTGTTPILENGEIAINFSNDILSIGKNEGNINFISEKKINDSLDLKQSKSDNTLTTNNKNIVGGINEINEEITTIKSKLPKITKAIPTLASGLSPYDSTVINEMVVDENGVVTYQFCVTGGKSNNNIANGTTLCTIPTTIPVNKICYGIVNLETTGGERRIAMSIVNPSNRQIMLYFIGDTTAVSSAKGTISWIVPTP